MELPCLCPNYWRVDEITTNCGYFIRVFTVNPSARLTSTPSKLAGAAILQMAKGSIQFMHSHYIINQTIGLMNMNNRPPNLKDLWYLQRPFLYISVWVFTNAASPYNLWTRYWIDVVVALGVLMSSGQPTHQSPPHCHSKCKCCEIPIDQVVWCVCVCVWRWGSHG